MAGPGGGPDTLLNAIDWSENSVALKDFSGKHPVPNICKVTKGQYRNVGVAKTVHSELYLHSIRTTKKVLAESVKVKPGKGPQVSEQKYSLPITYQGWFELLSEDGKAIKALQSVTELVKVFPQSCLVRENVKAFVPREGGELSLDRMQTLMAGEMLTLAGEVYVTIPTKSGLAKRRLLRCYEHKGDSVYLAYEQKGLFSPVAGQANISGVHSIKGLLEKFRLPIMVRLVHGTIPSKIERTFTGTFRLISVYSDEMAFVSPLRKEQKMVPISTREPLKLAAAVNFDTLRETDECKYFHQRCNTMITSYLNSIHILFAMPEPAVLEKGKEEGTRLQPSGKGKNAPTNAISIEEEEQIFETIDGIYQYVRDGKLPAPKKQQQAAAAAQAPATKADTSGGGNSRDKSKKKTRAPAPPQVMTPPQAATPMQYVNADSLGRNKPTSPITDDKELWEEPIYEPIDKIRNAKQKSVRLSVDSAQNEYGEARMDFDHEGGDGGFSSPTGSPEAAPVATPSPVTPGVGPVSSLRQVIKKSERSIDGIIQPLVGQTAGHVKEAIQTLEQNYDVLPPPVPPKNYDANDVPNTSPTATSIKLNGKRKGNAPPAPAGMINRVTGHSQGVTNGNGLQHPPYVAYAKVDSSYTNGPPPNLGKGQKQPMQAMHSYL